VWNPPYFQGAGRGRLVGKELIAITHNVRPTQTKKTRSRDFQDAKIEIVRSYQMPIQIAATLLDSALKTGSDMAMNRVSLRKTQDRPSIVAVLADRELRRR